MSQRPVEAETRMRAFITLKLNDITLDKEDMEMWTEFKEVLDAKDSIAEGLRNQLCSAEEDRDYWKLMRVPKLEAQLDEARKERDEEVSKHAKTAMTVLGLTSQLSQKSSALERCVEALEKISEISPNLIKRLDGCWSHELDGSFLDVKHSELFSIVFNEILGHGNDHLEKSRQVGIQRILKEASEALSHLQPTGKKETN